MTILDKIVARKKIEIAEAKSTISIDQLESYPHFNRECLSTRSFLNDTSRTGIIAEFKRQSPSKGIINSAVTVEEVVKAYAENGASAISVLTDNDFFGGTAADLQKARATVNIPLLRKDFVVDPYQIYEAKAWGADLILLIAACLEPSEVKELAQVAHQLGLEVLLEIHDDSELGHICAEIDLVGVNNRNLKTFEVSIQTSLDLVNKIPDSYVKIAESGIFDTDVIAQLKLAGFQGFLIGENFMRSTSPANAFASFVQSLNAIE